jgi:23S rRNA pseudouridine2605 synthase
MSDAERGDRIAKVLARAGLCSRREAERWITEGRVAIDGQVLTSPAVTVAPGAIVLVDGKPLAEPEPTRLWRYHKPAGLVTSHKDEKGRQTMFDALPAEIGRVISVGRLDLNSEGLILLTNDGELARKLELPSTGWIRRYKVRIHGTVAPERLLALEQGVTIDGVRYGPIKAELERQQGANAWCMMTLTEGKNREVRRVFEHLGCTVNRLIRLSYGPFQLGTLPRGEIEEVPRRVLRDQLGLGPAGDKGKRPAAPPAEQSAKTAKTTEPAAPPRPRRIQKPFRPHQAEGKPDKGGAKPRGRDAHRRG